MTKRIFLSYARVDLIMAQRLANDLRGAELTVWLDEDSLLPGQRWRDEITRAIRESDYFIALLSTASVTKRGYVQAEIAHALSVLEEFPPDQIYLVPVRLDDCKVSHPRLRDLHWVDLFPDWDAAVKKIAHVAGAISKPEPEESLLKRFRNYLTSRDDIPQKLINWAVSVDEEIMLVTQCLAKIPGHFAGITLSRITNCAQPLGVGRSVDELIQALLRCGILSPTTEKIKPDTYAEIDARRNPSYDMGTMFYLVRSSLIDAKLIEEPWIKKAI